MAHFCGACFFFSSRSERVMREKVERKEEANAAAATPTPTLWGMSTTTTMKKKPSLFSLAEAHSSSLCFLFSARREPSYLLYSPTGEQEQPRRGERGIRRRTSNGRRERSTDEFFRN